MAGRYCRLNRIDFRARQKAVARRIHNQRGNRRTQGGTDFRVSLHVDFNL